MDKADVISRLEGSIESTLRIASLAVAYADYKVVLIGFGEYTALRSLLEDLGVEYIDHTGQADKLAEIVRSLKVSA